MKKCVAVFIILLNYLQVHAQNYHPIPLDSVWLVETENNLAPQSGGPDCWKTTYKYVYSTSLTASINGNQYHEFRYNSFTTFQPIWPMTSCESSYTNSNVFYAFIRNDSINKKVYIYDTLDLHQEYVVYDFNMNLGDTIPAPSFIYNGNSCSAETFIVSKIDSIDLGAEFRKRFGITKPSLLGDTTYIIEGVGSDLGFMFPVFCPFEDGSTLICFHNNDIVFIPDSQIASTYCTPSLALENQAILAHNIVYPNTFNTFLVKNEEGKLIKITCYDVLGKFISENTFNESGYLNFSETSSGVYVMYIEYNGQTLKPYKFVISH